MHWHDEWADNGLLCKSAVSWTLTLLYSRNIGNAMPLSCTMIVSPNLHSYRGQTCLSRLTFMPGTNLLWDGPVNKGFRAELRSSLAWDNQHTIGPISGQHKFKLGHLSSMASKNMLRPYARYLISFIFYIIRSDKAFLWWWRILRMSSLTSSYFGRWGICQLVSIMRWDRLYVDYQYAISQ